MIFLLLRLEISMGTFVVVFSSTLEHIEIPS